MDIKYNFPWTGDVLFYTSTKINGLIISERQRSLGFSRNELIHAALIVDGRILIEATTQNGVKYVPMFSSIDAYKKYNPKVVLRNQSLARNHQEQNKILNNSYYYHKQYYDMKGAIFKSKIKNDRNICSTLVWMILSESCDFFPKILNQYNQHVYPAQLFEMLTAYGFEDIGTYEIPIEDKFGTNNDLSALNILELGQHSYKLEQMFHEVNSIKIFDQKAMLFIIK